MKPTVPEVLPIVNRLYARHSAGCCWHVVLDDGNEDCVSYCAASIEERGCSDTDHPGSTECIELAKLLPLMSATQIRKLCSSHT